MIEWPAVIKLQGDDELIFIASQQAWESSDERQQAFFSDDDCLVDSQGKVYRFSLAPNQSVMLRATDEYLDTEQLILLVKAHMSLIKACCVAKFYAENVAEAILAVQQIQGRLSPLS